MMQVVEMTDEEKLKMYMKLSKKELAKMLIACNDLIEHSLRPTVRGSDIKGVHQPITYYSSK